MTTCTGGLLKLSAVPQYVLDILQDQVGEWDYAGDKKLFDPVFGYFKAKFYHVSKITADIEYPKTISPVTDWVESIAGPNHKVVRCFLNLMEPNQSFNLHVDTLKVHLLAKRFHIPVVLGEGCTYYTYTMNQDGTWGETQNEMEYGFLYQLDNINPHNVKNKNGYRINLICDVIDRDLIASDLTSVDLVQHKIFSNISKHGLLECKDQVPYNLKTKPNSD